MILPEKPQFESDPSGVVVGLAAERLFQEESNFRFFHAKNRVFVFWNRSKFRAVRYSSLEGYLRNMTRCLIRRSTTTGLEILPGDTVWIAFIGGDSRYPIITGYRNPQAGNSVDWRRYHHKNYALICDRIIRLLVGNSVFQLNPDTITGSTTQALTLTIGSTSVSLTPNGLNLTCGEATVQMTPDSIKFNAGRIDLN